MGLGENFSYPITTEYDKRLDDSREGRGRSLSLETRIKILPRFSRMNRCARCVENCRVIYY